MFYKSLLLVIAGFVGYYIADIFGAIYTALIVAILLQSLMSPPKVEKSEAALMLRRKRDLENKKIWKYSKDGKKVHGPYSFLQMQRLARRGKIDSETLVYEPELDDWCFASETEILSETDEQPSTVKPTPHKVVTGSGFFVANRYVVTNYHVVEGHSKIQVVNRLFKSSAVVVSTDEGNDLALLKTRSGKANLQPASLRSTHVDLGEDVIAVGYPLGELLGEGLKATTGNVSGTTGVQNDARLLQVTAPVQGGNSGGPLLDKSCNVVGVVSSSLNELMIAAETGSLPQNINFAIKASMLDIFLKNARITPDYQDNDIILKNQDIVKEAEEFTVKVICKN